MWSLSIQYQKGLLNLHRPHYHRKTAAKCSDGSKLPKSPNPDASSSCGFNGRREILVKLPLTIDLLASMFGNNSSSIALASEFADMPALRGKDYGKTKMRYPDYYETKSGLQYKSAGLATREWPATRTRRHSCG